MVTEERKMLRTRDYRRVCQTCKHYTGADYSAGVSGSHRLSNPYCTGNPGNAARYTLSWHFKTENLPCAWYDSNRNVFLEAAQWIIVIVGLVGFVGLVLELLGG